MVGLVVPANVKYSPYVNLYIEILEELDIGYEIISWNRMNLEEDVHYVYNTKNMMKKNNDINKLYNYIMYSKFVKKVIKRKSYDKLIIFTAQMGIFLSGYLSNQYNKKYIIDIRDYSPLMIKFNKKFNTVKNSSCYIISSSPGFNEWINCKFTVCHNVKINSMFSHLEDQIVKPFKKEKYMLASIGSFLEDKINISLARRIKNNEILELVFIGNDTPAKVYLRETTINENLNNIKMLGEYSKSEVFDLYHQYCDFVNIIREKTIINRFALPNKFYEGLIAGKPIITTKSNYSVSQYVKKYNLGIILDNINDKDINQVIYNEIKKFNYNKFESGRRQFLNTIIEEQLEFKNTITAFLLKI